MSKCPSSIWCHDSNPGPFEHESSPITTRPGAVNNSNKKKLYFCFTYHIRNNLIWGRGGGQVVNLLAIYSNDPSLNLGGVYVCEFEQNENKQKESHLKKFI